LQRALKEIFMNIGGLFGALTPVFFVLAIGYLAGKRNAFDADQSAGLSPQTIRGQRVGPPSSPQRLFQSHQYTQRSRDLAPAVM
jgi:hypothetical protein